MGSRVSCGALIKGKGTQSKMSTENPSTKDDADQSLVEVQGNDPPIVHAEFEVQQFQAALILQKVYKSFRTRRQIADWAVLIEQKWWRVLDSAELKHSSVSFFDVEKPESAFSRWSRARRKAAKVGKGSCKDEKARQLALQHWLEAIDPRHRYGHNLQFYYLKWLHCGSNQPFFYWIDIGDGKEENLAQCPRQKLQQQCIKYLGPIERQKYEVIVEEGRFLHRETREILDTTKAPKGTKWIFVLSTSGVLYVGQKIKGVFQHSSFLAGGATLSAGRLVVEDGYLKAVWPHSGHYLPTEANFQAFMSFLMEHKVDITRVQKEPDDDEEDNFKKKGTFIALLRRLIIENSTSNTNETKLGEEGDKEDPNTSAEDTTSAKVSESPPDLPSQISELEKCTENEPVEPNQDGLTSIKGSSFDGHEPAEDSILSEKDLTQTKANLSGKDKKHDSMEANLISRRIESHRRTKSYQVGEQLGCRWTTGAGARIGCLRNYPSWLHYQRLDQVNLSPRGFSTTNLSGAPVPPVILKPDLV